MATSNFITVILLLLFAIITESAPLEFQHSNAQSSDDQLNDFRLSDIVRSTANDNKVDNDYKMNDNYKVNDNNSNNKDDNNDRNKYENVVVDDIIPGGRSQHRPVCKWVKKCVYGLWRVGWKFYTSYCYRRKVCTSSG